MFRGILSDAWGAVRASQVANLIRSSSLFQYLLGVLYSVHSVFFQARRAGCAERGLYASVCLYAGTLACKRTSCTDTHTRKGIRQTRTRTLRTPHCMLHSTCSSMQPTPARLHARMHACMHSPASINQLAVPHTPAIADFLKHISLPDALLRRNGA